MGSLTASSEALGDISALLTLALRLDGLVGALFGSIGDSIGIADAV